MECEPTQEPPDTQLFSEEPYVETKTELVWGRAMSMNPKYQNVDLKDDVITFGRRKECTVPLTHPAVSGWHCSLIRNDENVVLVKDTSTNGTSINGDKIGKGNQMVISSGDEMTIIKTDTECIAYYIYLQDHEVEPVEPNGPEEVYHLDKQIGNGAFATVRLCIHKKTGQKFAIKSIAKKTFALQNSSNRSDTLMDEVKILQQLDHPGIIKIYNVFETDSYLHLILELVQGGDLFDQIVSLGGKGYPEERARNIFGQIVEAIMYLHSRNIVHRDLKPENILLKEKDKDITAVSDFGLSRIVGQDSFMTTMCGTPQYLAPEVLINGQAGKGYDKAVDIWSLGVILYILLSGQQPFRDDDTILEQVKAGNYKFSARLWKHVSRSARDLVRGCLHIDPSQRMTPEEIMDHPWMKGLAEMPPGAKKHPPRRRRSREAKEGKSPAQKRNLETKSNGQEERPSKRSRPNVESSNPLAEAPKTRLPEKEDGPPSADLMSVGE